jgi:hypothetical protein
MRDGAAADERVHVDTCAACSERADAIGADARYAAAVLAMNDDVDTTGAYVRFVSRPRRVEQPRGRFGFPVGIAAAAVLAIALATTPLGSHAADLLSIFRPTTQAPINLSSTDLTSISKATALDGYGLFHRPKKQQSREVTLQQAAAQTGYSMRVPHVGPSVPHGVWHYRLSAGGTVSFTFDAKKARRLKMPVNVPAKIDGASVILVIHPTVTGFYSGDRGHATGYESSLVRYVQMAAPEVRTNGATLAELESFMLSQPQISPDVKAQFEAIADPSHTLPIPVDIDKRTASTVQVDGVSGLAIGDNTGLGAGVLWQKNGMLYVLAGEMKQDDLVALANAIR